MKSVQTLLFPLERIPRKRFFLVVVGFTAMTYIVAILPTLAGQPGTEAQPSGLTPIQTFMVSAIFFFRLCESFYAWWLIYDATLSKGTTWVLWLIGTALWFGLREWAVIVPLYLVFVLLPSKASDDR